ncbi:DUF397 domain-containing protein [Labedaea rhizosphaerae]|uniref:DUF397 domain-containing protein n=1 Tax=Labedaea rhizosphaerae TaxID=598644 RepID=UPI0014152E91|nr:DUF397 domain-containing protein [Labedaea rhizosphaerae]
MTFRKSSFSNTQSSCVELAVGRRQTQIRDSKRVAAGTLTIGAKPYAAWLGAVKNGDLDRPAT